MKKKYIVFALILFLGFILTGCEEQKKVNEDALKFKEEYEKMNGKTNANGAEHRTVSISEDNPFVYSSAEEIIKMIDNKESFFVYFGDTLCPWCRSVIEKAIAVSKDYNVKKIYYVKIWDDDHNEILRDVYQLNDDNEPVIKSEGTDGYKELLKKIENVLSDYNLTDSDGNKISTNEKRIYAPNFIFVKKGAADMLVEGISDKQKDSREELTDELLKDEEEIFNEFFEKGSSCSTDEIC